MKLFNFCILDLCRSVSKKRAHVHARTRTHTHIKRENKRILAFSVSMCQFLYIWHISKLGGCSKLSSFYYKQYNVENCIEIGLKIKELYQIKHYLGGHIGIFQSDIASSIVEQFQNFLHLLDQKTVQNRFQE